MAKKKRKRYTYGRVQEGEWIVIPRRRWRVACCDCGLVHVFNFRLVGGRLQVQAFRNERATAGRRRAPHVCRCRSG